MVKKNNNGTYKSTTSYFCGQVCDYKDNCGILKLNDECPVYQFAKFLAEQLTEPKEVNK